jgi:hypothetical protein
VSARCLGERAAFCVWSYLFRPGASWLHAWRNRQAALWVQRRSRLPPAALGALLLGYELFLFCFWLPKEQMKSFLLKVMVVGKNVGDALAPHHVHGDTVC